MILTQGAEYAIRVVFFLAKRDPNEPVQLKELAESVSAVESYLSKICQALRKAGIPRSHRGRKRGYSLAKSDDQINLLEVIQAIEGRRVVRCILMERECWQKCPVAKILEDIEESMDEKLRKVTLRNLVEIHCQEEIKEG